jgi:DNA-binding transcriptional regulator YiaG
MADGVKELIARLGLTQREAAGLCGVCDRTMRRWCSGVEPPPAAPLKLLCLMERLKLSRYEVEWLVADS